MPREIDGFNVYSLREVLEMPNNPQLTIVEKVMDRVFTVNRRVQWCV